jgi:hypothetical protein
MTDKQTELLTKAKAILKILSPLSELDRYAVAQIVSQLTDAENRSRLEAEQDALAAEKLAYVDKPYAINDPRGSGALMGTAQQQTHAPGGLSRGHDTYQHPVRPMDDPGR